MVVNDAPLQRVLTPETAQASSPTTDLLHAPLQFTDRRQYFAVSTSIDLLFRDWGFDAGDAGLGNTFASEPRLCKL